MTAFGICLCVCIGLSLALIVSVAVQIVMVREYRRRIENMKARFDCDSGKSVNDI